MTTTATLTPTTYTDAEFNAALGAPCPPSQIMAAAQAGIAHSALMELLKAKKDITAHIAAMTAAAEAAANAPIRIRKGRDHGVLLKSGKNKGKPGDATGALLEIGGAPNVFQACTPGQIVAVLANPVLAIELATAVDAGEQDGSGYTRAPEYQVTAQLIALADHYAKQEEPQGVRLPS